MPALAVRNFAFSVCSGILTVKGIIPEIEIICGINNLQTQFKMNKNIRKR